MSVATLTPSRNPVNFCATDILIVLIFHSGMYETMIPLYVGFKEKGVNHQSQPVVLGAVTLQISSMEHC
jgi:hypothetical protein